MVGEEIRIPVLGFQDLFVKMEMLLFSLKTINLNFTF